MKKLIIVNNNMKIGGVQKSLTNLLHSIHGRYDITLLLFSKNGALLADIPEDVKVISCSGLMRYLGMGQEDCVTFIDKLIRGSLVILCRLFGRSNAVKLMLGTEKKLPEKYDAAISYLHNGRQKQLYGGVNEFVLSKVDSDRKIAYLHCDYRCFGGNEKKNNAVLSRFDRIAACSEGCKRAFLEAMPELADKCAAAANFHRFDEIKRLAYREPVRYDASAVNILCAARLSHEKRLDRALYALKYCRERGVEAELHLVGDGAKRGELEELSRKLGIENHVRFYGEQNNPYAYMVNADLLLMTSEHEAAPMVIDEAACLSLPVLSTRTSSVDEMILARNIGRVCECDQKSINEALFLMISDREELNKLRGSMPPCNNAAALAQFEELIGG